MNLKERLFDPQRWAQAAQEAFHTFVVLVVPAFFAWAIGFQRLPNLEELKAFWYATVTAAAGAALKSFWWVLTGTLVPRSKKVKLEKP